MVLSPHHFQALCQDFMCINAFHPHNSEALTHSKPQLFPLNFNIPEIGMDLTIDGLTVYLTAFKILNGM